MNEGQNIFALVISTGKEKIGLANDDGESQCGHYEGNKQETKEG